FSHVKKLNFTVDEMKFELDEDSVVAVVLDFHTKAGYSARTVLLLCGKATKLSAPELYTIGLHREEVVVLKGERRGDGRGDWERKGDGERRGDGERKGDGEKHGDRDRPREGRASVPPGATVNIGPNGMVTSITRKTGEDATGSHESSSEIASDLLRGIEVRQVTNTENVSKLPEQAS